MEGSATRVVGYGRGELHKMLLVLQCFSLVMVIIWQVMIMANMAKLLFIQFTRAYRPIAVYAAMPVYEIGPDFVYPDDYGSPAAAAA
jgi:hypothetical protein